MSRPFASGPPGPRGVEGLDAYEVAVENGFVGTREEWLLGLVGEQGAAGTLEIGNVQASAPGDAPSVTNSGTPSEAILDFVLPRGDVGPVGATGPVGPAGPSVPILGVLDAEGDLPPTGSVGDGYLIDGDLWVWNDSSSEWDNSGPVQGPKGDPGVLTDLPALGTTDLDTVTTTGFYAQVSNTNATTDRNYPLDGYPGVLEVLQATSGQTLQRFTALSRQGPNGDIWTPVGTFERWLGSQTSDWVNTTGVGPRLSDQDLNDVRTPGRYEQASTRGISLNYPREDSAGVLEVFRLGPLGAVTQRYTHRNVSPPFTLTEFHRYYSPSQGWGPWTTSVLDTDTLDVYVAAGQSNIDGRVDITAAGTPLWLRGGLVPGVRVWNGSDLEQLDVNNPGPSGNGSSWVQTQSMGKWSFLHVALRELARGNLNVVLCQVASGGTPLAPVSNARGSWSPRTGDIPGGTPHLLTALLDRIDDLKNWAASNGKTIRWQALLWYQGESDSQVSGAGAAYAADFDTLIAAIRSDTDANLPVVLGTVPTASIWFDQDVENAHLGFAAGDSNAVCRDNSSLTLQNDDLHLDAAACIEFGRWVAEQL